MSIEDFTNSIKATFYERATSPLFGTFAASWIAWNYKLLFTLFGDGDYDTKFSYIELFLYPHWQIWVVQGFLIPFGVAIFIILAYPIPAKWLFVYWRTQQKKQKEAQQEIEEQTLLSLDESIKIKRSVSNQRILHDRAITEREDELKSLRGIIEELESENKGLRSNEEYNETIEENLNLHNIIKDMEKEIEELKNNTDDAYVESAPSAKDDKPMFESKIIPNTLGSMTSHGDTAESIDERSELVPDDEKNSDYDLTENEFGILSYFGKFDKVTIDSVVRAGQEDLSLDKNTVKYVLGELRRKSLLDDYEADSGKAGYHITHDGRGAIIKTRERLNKKKKK